MQLSPLPHSRKHRLGFLALTVGVHLALFTLWRMTSIHPKALDSVEGPAIQWIRAALPKPAAPVKPVSVQVERKERRNKPGTPSPITPRALPPREIPPAPAPPIPSEDPIFSTAPVTPSLRDRVMKDIGKIDKELQKESPGGRFAAPVNTPQSRLAAGIESATRAPHLWEAPRIEAVSDQGGYDRRIYKVTTAMGTYCVYYDSNHTPNGLDTMKNGIKPKIANCPRE